MLTVTIRYTLKCKISPWNNPYVQLFNDHLTQLGVLQWLRKDVWGCTLQSATAVFLEATTDNSLQPLQRSFLYCFRLTSPHVSRHLFFKCPLSFLLNFVHIYVPMSNVDCLVIQDTLYYDECKSYACPWALQAKSAWWRANLQQEPFVRLQRIAFVA